MYTSGQVFSMLTKQYFYDFYAPGSGGLFDRWITGELPIASTKETMDKLKSMLDKEKKT